MESGSPEAIWQRWNIPMYRAQKRYWGDHPRLEDLAAAYFKIKPKYTPPPKPEGPATPMRPIDWSLLDPAPVKKGVDARG